MGNTATRSQRRRNILILLWSSIVASGRDYLTGFAVKARKHGNWQLSLRMAKDLHGRKLIETITRGDFSGIVTNEEAYLASPELSNVHDTSIAVFGTYDPQAPSNVVFIQNDNAAIGRFAARHFLSLGNFRSYGFVHPESPTTWSRIRARAFHEELKRSGKAIEDFIDAEDSTHLADMLVRMPKPAAVMAASDYVAINVLETCKRVGIAVPGQTSVLGVDNDELLCEFDTPTLSSIEPRHDIAGGLAAHALELMFKGWPSDKPRLVVCDQQTIVERESTAALAPATYLIVTALDFIRKNATKSIRVDDVVRHLGVSRSLVDLRFREFHGESVNETILRHRLEAVRQRLITTRMSIGRVARSCGFNDVPHLQVIFKKRFGLPMGKWRQQYGTESGSTTPTKPFLGIQVRPVFPHFAPQLSRPSRPRLR